LPILLFSVVVHEFCRGWAAHARRDDSAERSGRLTLNPLDHFDPFGTLFLPAFCVMAGVLPIAWAKPMPSKPSRLRGPAGTLYVAAAGPAANVVLALCAALAFRACAALPSMGLGLRETALDALRFAATLNITLGFLHLLPIPPLDAGRWIAETLPAKSRAAIERLENVGAAAIVGLLLFGAAREALFFPTRTVMALLARVGLFV